MVLKQKLGSDVRFKDWVEAIVFDKDWNVRQIHIAPDLVTTAGKVRAARLLVNDLTANHFEYIGIGSGSTAASTVDTNLDNPFKRAAATGTVTTTTITNDTAQFVYQFASGKPGGLNGASTGSRGIVESGLFTDSATGAMMARQTFSALNLNWDTGDTLQITWKIQVT